MNEKDFCYWLQGFVELQDSDVISEKQWLVIKDHLKLVFDKKTPDRSITISAPEIKIGEKPHFDYNKISESIGRQHTHTHKPTDFGPPYTITC